MTVRSGDLPSEKENFIQVVDFSLPRNDLILTKTPPLKNKWIFKIKKNIFYKKKERKAEQPTFLIEQILDAFGIFGFIVILACSRNNLSQQY